MPAYTLLSSRDMNKKSGSGNVGDSLITEQCMALINHLCGKVEFREYAYTDDLTEHINVINETDAVLMSVFTFWKDLKQENPLFRYLDKITVPVIPLSSNTIFFPGRACDVAKYRMSSEDVNCIRLVMKDAGTLPCRESIVEAVLHNHGITETTMVGDFGWYDLAKIDVPMTAPKEINKIVFTTGHYPHYHKQAISVIKYLREKFPTAEITHFTHCKYSCSGELLKVLLRAGVKAITTPFETSVFDQYENYDLHVGYRVHGYVGFLRKRRPAILIAEDNRGLGFGCSLGNVGVFPGLTVADKSPKSTIRKIFGKRRDKAYYMVDPDIVLKIDKFIDEQISTNFASYSCVANIIDFTYHNRMIPYLKKVLKL